MMTNRRLLAAIIGFAAAAASIAVSATPASAAMCFKITTQNYEVYDGPIGPPVTVPLPTVVDVDDCNPL